jgi:hypothetical protein
MIEKIKWILTLTTFPAAPGLPASTPQNPKPSTALVSFNQAPKCADNQLFADLKSSRVWALGQKTQAWPVI